MVELPTLLKGREHICLSSQWWVWIFFNPTLQVKQKLMTGEYWARRATSRRHSFPPLSFPPHFLLCSVPLFLFKWAQGGKKKRKKWQKCPSWYDPSLVLPSSCHVRSHHHLVVPLTHSAGTSSVWWCLAWYLLWAQHSAVYSLGTINMPAPTLAQVRIGFLSLPPCQAKAKALVGRSKHINN